MNKEEVIEQNYTNKSPSKQNNNKTIPKNGNTNNNTSIDLQNIPLSPYDASLSRFNQGDKSWWNQWLSHTGTRLPDGTYTTSKLHIRKRYKFLGERPEPYGVNALEEGVVVPYKIRQQLKRELEAQIKQERKREKKERLNKQAQHTQDQHKQALEQSQQTYQALRMLYHSDNTDTDTDQQPRLPDIHSPSTHPFPKQGIFDKAYMKASHNRLGTLLRAANIYDDEQRQQEDHSDIEVDQVVPDDNEFPSLSIHQSKNYFGREAKESFYALAHEIQRQHQHYTSQQLNDISNVVLTQHRSNPKQKTPKGFSSKTSVLQRLTSQGSASSKHIHTQQHHTNDTIDTHAPSSRIQYLFGCLSKNIVPRANLLLRKVHTKELDLKHQGMGDDLAAVLAAALVDIPYVEILDLTDNRLTDKGLSLILTQLKRKNDLNVLNISENRVGLEAIIQLKAVVASDQSILSKLVMSKCNITEENFSVFFDLIELNERPLLKYLDVSHNNVGKYIFRSSHSSGTSNALTKLGDWIASFGCHIEYLDISWNKIHDYASIQHLLAALRYNQTINNLNLGHNNLGRKGGEYLGYMLSMNDSLLRLDVSHNQLLGSSVFCIAVAINRHNEKLQYLNLNGNPVGTYGAKTLISIRSTRADSIDISLEGCNLFQIESGKEEWFSYEDVGGEYTLDMNVPYERAIADMILTVCMNIEGCDVRQWVERKGSSRTSIALTKTKKRKGLKSRSLRRKISVNMDGLGSHHSSNLVKAFQRKKSIILNFASIFKELDEQNNGSVDINTLKQYLLLHPEDMKYDDDIFQSFIEANDITHDIEKSEFFHLLSMFTEENKVKRKLDELDTVEYMMINTQVPNKVYKIPEMSEEDDEDSGMFIDTEIVSEISEESKQYMTESKALWMIKLLQHLEKKSDLIELIPNELQLHAEHAQRIINKILDPDNDLTFKSEPTQAPAQTNKESVQANVLSAFLDNLNQAEARDKKREEETNSAVSSYKYSLGSVVHGLSTLKKLTEMSRILPKLSNPHQCKKFIHKNVRNETQRYSLKRAIGDGNFDILIGIYNGHFVFDLSRGIDRLCLKRLLEQNTSEKKRNQIQLRKNDLSQIGNWNKIRNERYNGTRFNISKGDFKNSIPSSGVVELDYISSNAPVHNYTIYLEESHQHSETKESELKKEEDSTVLHGDNVSLIGCTSLMKVIRRAGFFASDKQEEVEEMLKSLLYEEFESDQEVWMYRTYELMKDLTNHTYLQTDCEKANAIRDMLSQLHGGTSASQNTTHTQSTHNSRWKWDHLDSNDYILYISVNTPQVMFEKMSYLIEFCSERWLSTYHIIAIFELLPYIKHLRHDRLGSIRVEFIIKIFNRIVDWENIRINLCSRLDAYEEAYLIYRVGWLSLFNPLSPDGFYSLNLGARDERQLVKSLMHLAVVEPGENWNDEQFCWGYGEEHIPGFRLPKTWFTEDGMPKKGILTVRYYTLPGLAVWNLRFILFCNFYGRWPVYPLLSQRTTTEHQIRANADLIPHLPDNVTTLSEFIEEFLAELGLDITYTV